MVVVFNTAVATLTKRACLPYMTLDLSVRTSLSSREKLLTQLPCEEPTVHTLPFPLTLPYLFPIFLQEHTSVKTRICSPGCTKYSIS